MKAAHLVCLLVCLLFAAFVHAQEKDDPAKEAQIKQQVLKDIKKTCTPQKKQSEIGRASCRERVSSPV